MRREQVQAAGAALEALVEEAIKAEQYRHIAAQLGAAVRWKLEGSGRTHHPECRCVPCKEARASLRRWRHLNGDKARAA